MAEERTEGLKIFAGGRPNLELVRVCTVGHQAPKPTHKPRPSLGGHAPAGWLAKVQSIRGRSRAEGSRANLVGAGERLP